ncbi:MAG: TIGR02281 family clan AA aspartic protease [Lentilitoribacter sp.]
MLQKVMPFVFIAVTMAFVPQFLDNAPETVAQGNTGPVGVTKTAQPSNVAPSNAHYTTGKRQVSIKANSHGHFLADFKAGGRSINGLIDTGATYVAMNRSTARSIGVKVSNSDFKHKAETANGIVKAALKNIDRLELGPVSAKNVDVFILDDTALSSTLIGMSFLNKLSSFKVENGNLILTQ